jgi:hypothetical protein
MTDRSSKVVRLGERLRHPKSPDELPIATIEALQAHAEGLAAFERAATGEAPKQDDAPVARVTALDTLRPKKSGLSIAKRAAAEATDAVPSATIERLPTPGTKPSPKKRS